MAIVGIKAMRRLGRDIGRWPDMLPPAALKTAVWSIILQGQVKKGHLFPRFLAEAGDILGSGGLRRLSEQAWACDDSWTDICSALKQADDSGNVAGTLQSVASCIGQLADREEAVYQGLVGLLSGPAGGA